MKKTIIIFFVLIHSISFAQKKDSILINERTIDRPLTLHKGQLQINAGYGISIISADYDEKGKKTNLAELGTASVLHEYNFDFHFGILEFWEISTSLNYVKKVERSENEFFLSALDPSTDVSYLYNHKGFDNLHIGTRIRYPFASKWFDFYIKTGISLPVFYKHSKEPEHIYTPLSEETPYITIKYNYNYPISNGANQFDIGGGAKFRYNDFAVSAFYELVYPISESTNTHWTHRLLNNDFVYEENDYEFLVSDTKYLMINAEYQALPWFNVRLGFSSYSEINGWSEESSFRLPNPEKSLNLLSASYEIKITGKMWLSQNISFPVSAKNMTASLTFLTGISYNSFLFNK